MIDPTILKYWKKNGFSKVWRAPNEYPIKISGITYIPYQFAYDKTLGNYIWKFRRGDAEAGASVS